MHGEIGEPAKCASGYGAERAYQNPGTAGPVCKACVTEIKGPFSVEGMKRASLAGVPGTAFNPDDRRAEVAVGSSTVFKHSEAI